MYLHFRGRAVAREVFRQCADALQFLEHSLRRVVVEGRHGRVELVDYIRMTPVGVKREVARTGARAHCGVGWLVRFERRFPRVQAIHEYFVYAEVGRHGKAVIGRDVERVCVGSTLPLDVRTGSIVKEARSGRNLWALRVGDMSGDPVLDGNRIYVGTDAGVLYAFEAQGHERIAWQFRAGAPLRASPAVGPSAVYAAANDGSIYALDKATGKVLWTYKVRELETRAFHFFSTPEVRDGRVFVGAANRRLYCLNAASGKLLWQAQTSDWIRAKPLVAGPNVVVASMDGTVQAFGPAGSELWRAKASSHQVMADLAGDEAGILVSSSDLYLHSLRPSDGKLQWRHSLLEAAYIDGQRITADMIDPGRCRFGMLGIDKTDDRSSTLLMMANWETSAEEPAVVGMQMRGGPGAPTLSTPSKSRILAPLTETTLMPLAQSIGLPPPRATMTSQVA